MDTQQFNCLPLYGRRIFIVEEDDALYCLINRVLLQAGGETLGALAHFPDMSVMIPAMRIDAAVVDVDGRDTSLLSLVDAIGRRDIPMLFIGGQPTPEFSAARHAGHARIGKPMRQQDLIDGVIHLL